MVGATAKLVERTADDDLVLKAHTQAEALGRMNIILKNQIPRKLYCSIKILPRLTEISHTLWVHANQLF